MKKRKRKTTGFINLYFDSEKKGMSVSNVQIEFLVLFFSEFEFK